jgi:hypothetical protein
MQYRIRYVKKKMQIFNFFLEEIMSGTPSVIKLDKHDNIAVSLKDFKYHR